MMQSTPPPAPPPAQFQNSTQIDSFFSKFPCVIDAGIRKCILGLNVTGKKDDVEAVRSKLAAEGWQSEYLSDASGAVSLSVNPETKTVPQTTALAGRFKNHEFGPVEMKIMAVPAPAK